MSDERVREAERRYQASGDADDGWAWVREVIRYEGVDLDTLDLAKRLVRLERTLDALLRAGRASQRLDTAQNAFSAEPDPNAVVHFLRSGSTKPPEPPCRHGVDRGTCAICIEVSAEAEAGNLCILRITYADAPHWLLQPGRPMCSCVRPPVTVKDGMLNRTDRFGTVLDAVWDERESVRAREPARRFLDLLTVFASNAVRLASIGTMVNLRAEPEPCVNHPACIGAVTLRPSLDPNVNIS